MLIDLYNTIPDTFFTIIFCQFVVFLVFALVKKKTIREMLWSLKYGLLLGVPLGVFFDITAGYYGGVFDYGEGHWNAFFLFMNGLLSYGIAIATLLIFNISFPKIQNNKNNFLKALLFFMALAGILVFVFANEFVLARMIGIGFIFIFLGEFLLLNYAQKYGPVSSLFRRNSKSFLQIATLSISIGLIYEICNWYNPLWYFTQSKFLTNFHLEILIVLFGYFVLVHSMYAFWEIFKK